MNLEFLWLYILAGVKEQLDLGNDEKAYDIYNHGVGLCSELKGKAYEMSLKELGSDINKIWAVDSSRTDERILKHKLMSVESGEKCKCCGIEEFY